MTEDKRKECSDFDEYVNNEWKCKTSIPPAYGKWNNFYILNNENLDRLTALVENAGPETHVNQLYQKLLLQEDLHIDDNIYENLDCIGTTSLTKERAFWIHNSYLLRIGTTGVYHISKETDSKNSSRYVPTLRQSGLGMPDRTYYLDRSDLTNDYKILITKLFALVGRTVDVDALYFFEKELAKIQLAREEMREVDKMYNVCQWTDYEYLQSFYGDLPANDTQNSLIVNDVCYLHKVNILISTIDETTLNDYIRWRYLLFMMPHQNKTAVQIQFDFFGAKLGGRKEPQPTKKRAIMTVARLLRDELGQLYVEKYFDKDQQTKCQTMINCLRLAVEKTLSNLSWMTPETRAKAVTKFNVFTMNIGYPKKWLDYSRLHWSADMSLSRMLEEWGHWDWNVCEEALFYQKIDHDYWHMGAFEVNAYCDQTLNGVYFPAGILQKPFFGHDTLEENLGSIGVIIGHEITHGFDDQGRKYDTRGQLTDWWSSEDVQNYNLCANCVRDHFGLLETNCKKVNGQLTLGENIADIGGVQLALLALELSGQNRKSYDLFFQSYARLWREVATDAALDQQLTTDCHAPAHWRINGVLAHIDEFYETYDVQPCDPMYLAPEKRSRLWGGGLAVPHDPLLKGGLAGTTTPY